MNERWTAFFAVVAAEAGGSLALFLLAPVLVRTAGFTSLPDTLIPHTIAVAVVWGVIASIVWIFVPDIWRIRQEMSNKIRKVLHVYLISLLIDTAATVYFYLDPAALAGADVRAIPSRWALGAALVLRSAGALVCFWVTVIAHREIVRRRIEQATPPPLFGKS